MVQLALTASARGTKNSVTGVSVSVYLRNPVFFGEGLGTQNGSSAHPHKSLSYKGLMSSFVSRKHLIPDGVPVGMPLGSRLGYLAEIPAAAEGLVNDDQARDDGLVGVGQGVLG